jgi:hypothetical protein
MSSSQTLRIISMAVLLSGGVALANESAKQLPLEIPPSLLDKEPSKPTEKAKPEAVKKTAPKTEKVAASEVTAVNLPAVKPAAQPVKDLSGLPEMASYKTKTGDTLEKILQKFYPASPLRSEVLRDAVIQNNPKAFPKGNAKSLVMGSTLSMPDQSQLTKRLVLTNPDAGMNAVPASNGTVPGPSAMATPAVPAGGGGAAAHSAGHNMALQDPKRNWVRYP